MPRFLPKTIAEEVWRKLEGNRAYAVRSGKEDEILIRLGGGKGIFIAVIGNQFEGRLLNLVDYESGKEELLIKLNDRNQMIIGRGSDVAIKILHAYVSRQHLQLTLHRNILVIKDFGAKNGTFVLAGPPMFDIFHYAAGHPPAHASDSTLDQVHLDFGADLDEFLIEYTKKGSSDENNNTAPVESPPDQENQL